MVENRAEVIAAFNKLAEEGGRPEHICQISQIRSGILALGNAQLLDGLMAGDEEDGKIIGLGMRSSGEQIRSARTGGAEGYPEAAGLQSITASGEAGAGFVPAGDELYAVVNHFQSDGANRFAYDSKRMSNSQIVQCFRHIICNCLQNFHPACCYLYKSAIENLYSILEHRSVARITIIKRET